MSGHSHWSTIKRKKAAVDAKRGKLWSKLSRNVMIAARLGGGDPEMNPRLRLATDKARAANMTRDAIDKAIKKGTGELEGETYEELLFEGYGPGGVAILCQGATDNRNRTAPEIKKIFERRGGNLGGANCVAWMFEQKGLIHIKTGAVDEDTLLEVVLEAGGDDVQVDGKVYEVTSDIGALSAVQQALGNREIPVLDADISMVPANYVVVDENSARKLFALLEELDDHDDVQNVYNNADIPDDVLARLES
jgi:YebC/PmpR family DNA-binding regulatory protein